MTQTRLSLLEASLDVIKEKIKSTDFGRSQLENRLTAIETKIVALSSTSNHGDKENFSHFDVHLSSSQLFATSLKKVDNNATSNLRKLEDHMGQMIMESHSKFSQIQEKLLGMLTQKEKILRNMNFQIQNQSHAINAIEEWIRTDHQQVNSLHLVEENLRQKLEMIQKNNDIKVEILEQKIKYLQQFKESTQGHIRVTANTREELEEQMKTFKKLMKKQTQQLVTAQIKNNQDSGDGVSKMKREVAGVLDETEELKRKLNKQIDRMEELQNAQNRIVKRMGSFEQQFTFNRPTREQEATQIQQNPFMGHERMKSSSFERKQNYESNTTSKKIPEVSSSRNLKPELPRSAKKEMLPPRKGFLGDISGREEELSPPSEMMGGMRGLLQRSKEKGRQTMKEEPRGGLKKGLPPVRDDPLARKKKNQIEQKREQEEQQVVYQVDEQGYLLDEDGNYLQDESGNMIKLSPEEIDQYVTDR